MVRNAKQVVLNRDAAEEIAVAVFGWLASEPDLLGRFLALTGMQPDQLRGAVGDPGFLAGVIEFVMGHEPTLMDFCAATDTRPEVVAAAAHALSGPSPGPGEY